jgi:hypothetical protein
MKFLPILTLLLPYASIFADTSAAHPPNPYEVHGGRRAPTFSEANAAAIHFLNIVDNYVFGGAWLEMAGLVHDIVPQNVWADGMQAARVPLGTVHARRVTTHHPATALPHGTKGNFMVINYATQFAKKPNSIETVTLIMVEPIGEWRVVSYIVGNR